MSENRAPEDSGLSPEDADRFAERIKPSWEDDAERLAAQMRPSWESSVEGAPSVASTPREAPLATQDARPQSGAPPNGGSRADLEKAARAKLAQTMLGLAPGPTPSDASSPRPTVPPVSDGNIVVTSRIVEIAQAAAPLAASTPATVALAPTPVAAPAPTAVAPAAVIPAAVAPAAVAPAAPAGFVEAVPNTARSVSSSAPPSAIDAGAARGAPSEGSVAPQIVPVSPGASSEHPQSARGYEASSISSIPPRTSAPIAHPPPNSVSSIGPVAPRPSRLPSDLDLASLDEAGPAFRRTSRIPLILGFATVVAAGVGLLVMTSSESTPSSPVVPAPAAAAEPVANAPTQAETPPPAHAKHAEPPARVEALTQAAAPATPPTETPPAKPVHPTADDNTAVSRSHEQAAPPRPAARPAPPHVSPPPPPKPAAPTRPSGGIVRDVPF